MRQYSELSMKNLFRRPSVMGVSFSGLLALAFLVLFLMILLGSSKWSNIITSSVSVLGYISLRLCNQFLIGGWEDELFYPVEKWLRKTYPDPEVNCHPIDFEILSPDTMEKTMQHAKNNGDDFFIATELKMISLKVFKIIR